MEKEYDGKRKVFLRMVISACIAVFVFGHPLSASADVIFEPDMISMEDTATNAHI